VDNSLLGTVFQLKTDDAGFTVEERESFEINFTMRGFIDTFRKQQPKAVGYTFWGENQRRNNKGTTLHWWMID
jgi:exodeoxyribonuclease-3